MAQFDIHAIKRIPTSLSDVRVEKKGQDPREIKISGVSIALANKLPSFYPPTDAAFISRLVILPHESIFYADEETKDDLLNQGVSEDRLHPARSHAEIMNDIESEKAGILKTLISDYIELRDKHNLRPVESKSSKQLKAHYREINDLIQQFMSDYFVKDETGFITNDRLEELWKEFSGQTRPKMKTIRDEIEERWTEIKRDIKKITVDYESHTKRGLSGIKERNDEDTKLQKTFFSISRKEKKEKSNINTENEVFCNLVTEKASCPFSEGERDCNSCPYPCEGIKNE